MPNLSDELHVSPRQRITVPEGSVALIVPQQLGAELRALLMAVRRKQLKSRQESLQIVAPKIAGDILLAMLDDENWVEVL